MSYDAHAELAAVLGCDGPAVAAGEAITVLGRVRRLRGVLDRFEAELTVRLEQLHAQGASAPAADMLSRHQHMSAAEARRRQRRATALANAPKFGDGLANGKVGAEHADALANATAKLDEAVKAEFFSSEESLLATAAQTTPEQFARHCRQLVGRLERDQGLARNQQQRRDSRLTIKPLPDGMHQISGIVHPELGATLTTAIALEVDKLVAAGGDRGADRAHLAAVALGNLVSGGHQAARPAEAEILVVIDETTFRGGLHDHSLCETDDGVELPPDTIRRLACNARLRPVIIGNHGEVLNLGHQQRLANRAQRRALRAMYRTCAFPHCDVTFNKCEVHHISPWELGGPTDLINLLPLCAFHHHLVHELAWKLELDHHRTLTIHQPDGTLYASQPLEMCNRGAGRDKAPQPKPPDHPHRQQPDQTALPLTA
jgi:hypothetical protein